MRLGYRSLLTSVDNNEAVIRVLGRTGAIGVQRNMCHGTLRGNIASLGLGVYMRQVSSGPSRLVRTSDNAQSRLVYPTK